jgi:hypothetical protein
MERTTHELRELLANPSRFVHVTSREIQPQKEPAPLVVVVNPMDVALP